MTRLLRLCSLSIAIGLALTATTFGQDAQDQAAVQAVRESGGQVLELAQNDPRLDVAFHLSNVELRPEIMNSLDGVKGRLAHLNLRGTNLNDELAQYLKPLTELERLHLEKTAITDAALPNLADMQKLSYLNLYGTGITDAGLQHLAALKSLKKLYVWETKVTLDGVRALKKELPELEIIGGPEEPKPVQPVEAPRPAAPAAE